MGGGRAAACSATQLVSDGYAVEILLNLQPPTLCSFPPYRTHHTLLPARPPAHLSIRIWSTFRRIGLTERQQRQPAPMPPSACRRARCTRCGYGTACRGGAPARCVGAGEACRVLSRSNGDVLVRRRCRCNCRSCAHLSPPSLSQPSLSPPTLCAVPWPRPSNDLRCALPGAAARGGGGAGVRPVVGAALRYAALCCAALCRSMIWRGWDLAWWWCGWVGGGGGGGGVCVGGGGVHRRSPCATDHAHGVSARPPPPPPTISMPKPLAPPVLLAVAVP